MEMNKIQRLLPSKRTVLISSLITTTAILWIAFFAEASTKAAQKLETANGCLELRERGTKCPANPPTKKFYYDQRMGVCQPFIYNGCYGNGNRFDAADDCMRSCSPIKNGGVGAKKNSQWTIDEKCNGTYLIPNGQYIKCSMGKGNNGCPKGHLCAPREAVCCPTRDHVCGMKDDSGALSDRVVDLPRFAWVPEIHNCIKFSYFGANGNYNNFPSHRQCLSFCKRGGHVDKI